MSVLHVVLALSPDDESYIIGALRERHQTLEDFAREALLEWAAR